MKALPLLLFLTPVFGHEPEKIPKLEYQEPYRVPKPPVQPERQKDPPIIIVTPCDRQGREQCWVVVE